MTATVPETDLGAPDGDPTLFSALAWAALQEDIASGDATTLATVPEDLTASGRLVARQRGVISGIDAVQAVLEAGASYPVLGGRVELQHPVHNGTHVTEGALVGTLNGPVRAILQLERTVLNVLSHASGVATHTAAWVEAVSPPSSTCPGAGTVVRDSRKTLPGLRLLQKRAVVHGGGTPHRYNLSDQAMVKDNHVVAGGGVVAAYLAVRADNPALWCEVEVDDLDQLRAVLAVDVPPQQVLLDNFAVPDTVAAVRMRDEIAPGVLLESSGGLTLDVAGEYAAAGVDSLAVGALTHSVTALDIGLDL
ncbi:carboxylating nicotinate-nucleotide diphosphorylase [Corynebacterium glyciniphilum]|uniref:carboxylating nicotinate-nucleotide diphosphorylase n=1 Tax=Corynebacterium glyciniphilum TaxID=1404244 RepID=UPI00264AA92E|nr:carboxylating nicotinate-nucleotide diphosphorylase [Corynebacterium glyciniphilum]MDN6704937.1 carboxylating nicotinate-nucleotide diphosphorylase [Corynebacterium glyciniphilum]